MDMMMDKWEGKGIGGDEEVEATVEIARWESLTANDQVTQISINNSAIYLLPSGITTHIKSQATIARVFEPHVILACSLISSITDARPSLELRGVGNLSQKKPCEN